MTHELSIAEAGSGRPVLILHGGGGPATVAPIAGALSPTMHTLVPTHPGWNGTERPESLTSISALAADYLEFLIAAGLTDVLVIGSSVGGWIAAEIALQDTTGVLSQLVLIDAGGIEVADAPMRDFFGLDARGVAEFSFHDSERFYVDPATIPAEQLQLRLGNMAALRVFAGDPYMHDPTLRGRLSSIAIPTLLLWGESDRIMTPEYGAAFAAAIPDARLEIIAEAGHLPQLEQPAATLSLIREFAASAR